MRTISEMIRSLLCLIIVLTILSSKSVEGLYNAECSRFLASDPRPLHVEIRKGDTAHLVTASQNYQLHHGIVLNILGPIAEDRETTSLCFSIDSITSYTTDKEDGGKKNNLAAVTVETDKHAVAGIINVTADCWARERLMAGCKPIFMLMNEKLTSPILAFSPLSKDFWDLMTDATSGLAIKELDIQTYNRTIPSSWVPSLSISTLESLQIMGNDWRRPETLISSLRSLMRLDLTDNNIQELPEDTFNNTPLLRHLLLARNNLSVFPAGLNKLRMLSLLDITNPEGRAQLTISTEQITTIRQVQTMGLENINLSANITDLLQLPNLRFLNLSGCGIEEIHDIMWDTPPTPLIDLDLSKNKLSKLPRMLFSHLRDMQTLHLHHNEFESCPDVIIENLIDLEYLDMSYNKISHLTTLCFEKHHYNLEYLDLSHNQLSHITDGAFQTLESLRRLKLSNNNLTVIRPGYFEGVSRLNLLDLSNNQISTNISFKAITILELKLSNNNLVSLANIMEYGSKFDELDVSFNNLTKWTQDFPRAEHLNLSYNAMTNLCDETRKCFNDFFRLVDLGGNAFNCCDVELEKLKEWLRFTHVDVQNLGTKFALKCLIPGENQKYPIRTFLDEEGLCHNIQISVEKLQRSDVPILHGTIGVLATFVIVLSVALGYVLYKQRHNVLTWLKFTDS